MPVPRNVFWISIDKIIFKNVVGGEGKSAANWSRGRKKKKKKKKKRKKEKEKKK